jgi:anti-sigma-K factor RskA
VDAVRPDRPGHLRVSDADRDRAISDLAGHYQVGRLTAEELADRSGQALQARTEHDLAVVLADLPGPEPAAARPRPAPRTGTGTRRTIWALALIAQAIVVVVAVAVPTAGHRGISFTLAPIVIALVILHLRSGRR